jgi:hypothetical protein
MASDLGAIIPTKGSGRISSRLLRTNAPRTGNENDRAQIARSGAGTGIRKSRPNISPASALERRDAVFTCVRYRSGAAGGRLPLLLLPESRAAGRRLLEAAWASVGPSPT